MDAPIQVTFTLAEADHLWTVACANFAHVQPDRFEVVGKPRSEWDAILSDVKYRNGSMHFFERYLEAHIFAQVARAAGHTVEILYDVAEGEDYVVMSTKRY
jgi:hypothetical protein